VVRNVRAGALILDFTLGLVSRKLPLGVPVWDKYLGDACYAVAVYLVVALLRPKWDCRQVAVVAGGVCAAIEAFQLTGIPQRLAGVPGARWILGTTFAWGDLAAYLAGIAVIFLLDRSFIARSRKGA
jgi:hypothetical protein